MNLGQLISSAGDRIGPSMVAQWAHEHGHEFPNGAANKKILAGLALHGMNVQNDASHDWTVKVSSHASLHHGICMANLKDAREADVEGTLSSYEFYSLMPFLKLMVGFAFEMQTNPYPGFRFYTAASELECDDGVTVDFTKKHISTTNDFKSALRVARVRIKPLGERAVQTYGRAVTRFSGALTRSAAPDFQREILTRQKEFKSVYDGLMREYASAAVYSADSVNSTSDVHGFDSLEFETADKYDIFEFENAKGGSDECYIKFSLSSNSDGSRFAVNHLSGTHHEKGHVHRNATRVSTILGDYSDASTTVRKIF